jgi:tape measure domain-containing protein
MKLYEYVLSVKDQFSPTLQNLQKVAGVGQNKVENLARSMNQTSNIASNLGRTLSGVFAVGGVVSFSNYFVKAGAELEQTRISYQTMVGDVTKGNKLLGDLTKLANVTPYENSDLLKAGQTLLNFGYSAQKIKPMLSSIGNVAAGDANKLQSLTLAFGQVNSAGKLTGQDLLQFINAGFNPLNEISKLTGKSMSVLKDEMSKGAISAQLVERAFISATSAGGRFYQMSERQSQTLAGKWSTLKGTLNDTVAVYSEKMTPALGKLVDAGNSLLSYMTNNINLMKVIGGVLVTSVIGWQAYSLYTTLATAATGGFTTVLGALNLAFIASPIGIFAASVAGLVGGLVLLYNHSENVRKAVDLMILSFKTEAEIKSGAYNDRKIAAYREETKAVNDLAASLQRKLGISKEESLQKAAGIESKQINSRLQVLREAASGRLPEVFLQEAGLSGKSQTDILKEIGDNKSRLAAVDKFINQKGIQQILPDLPDNPSGKTKFSNGSDSISSGGSKAIHITIQKVQIAEQYTQVLENGNREAGVEVQEQIKEVLSRVINGGIYTANQ